MFQLLTAILKMVPSDFKSAILGTKQELRTDLQMNNNSS
jgi:hypothetical protein